MEPQNSASPQPQQPEQPTAPQSVQEASQPPVQAAAPVSSEESAKWQKVHNPLETLQPGERLICEIKRHPIGLFGLYASVGLIVLLVIIFGYGLGPSMLPDVSKTQIFSYTTLALAIAVLFGGVALLVGQAVYRGNRWIVTSDSVTQITQLSLFNKQSSQLSMANIEDVTSEKSGLFPHMFNYGSLKAETAGERQKFKLMFCPDPDHYAKLILQAREEFEQEHYRLSTNGNQNPRTS